MNRPTISPERLAELAQRKLAALGIASGLAQDGKTLVGRIPVQAGTMVNPLSGEPIQEVRFAVVGHDKVRLVAPQALAELAPQPFYDQDQPVLLLARITECLARRASAAQWWETTLRARGFVARLDATRIVALGQVDLSTGGRVLLEGSDRGLFATLAMRPGDKYPLRLGEVPIDLEDYPDRADLEVSLKRWMEEAEQKPAAGAAPVLTQPVVAPDPAAVPGIPLSTYLARADGDLRVLAFSAVKMVTLGEEKLRFSLEQRGAEVIGRLQKPGALVWEGRVDLATFPGVEAFVARLTGQQPAPAAAPPVAAAVPTPAAPPASRAVMIELPPPAPGSQPQGPIPNHALPIKGERWVMTVREVNRASGQVAYAPVDAHGVTYGEPARLEEGVFSEVFADLGGGSHRLSVEVKAVESARICYLQLDAKGGSVGQQRCVAPGVFVATFLPEAAAY
ncbi:MAG: hypothetical protein P1V51_05815 [Deltaproteobacteria bacterium]|nr:hypothetical protein [Deltaproteobacteria bacterium]